MRLSFHCPSCGKPVDARVSPPSAELKCPCGWTHHVTAEDWTNAAPRRCLVCSNSDLWRQKSFPQAAGLAAIAVQIVVSTWFWYRHEPQWTYLTLILFAVADMVLFTVMPDVLVCYRCRARHGSPGQGTEHGSFDHETAERYRQERLRTSAK